MRARTHAGSIGLATGLAIALGVGLAAGAGAAQDAPSAAEEGTQARARVHFQAGASYYEAGAYDDALREWTRAYELSPRPELLYNLSLAYQGLNRLSEARDHLRRFLDEVSDIPNRANLELRVENLERRIAAQAEAMAPPDDEPDPGPAVALEPPRASPPPAASSGGGGAHPAAIAGFVVAGVGVATYAIFGGLTLAEDARLQTDCATPCGPGAADTLRAFALTSDIGLGVALAGAIVGVVFLFVDAGGEAVAAAPWLDRDGGGVVARGTF
ncbi:MAG: tetratricopeptide repeat protein [Sandaracinaceae bacterium]|nr:tetratricopeptide repeat protein [Sandaracinaceae bacterium]